jgi:6-phosphogluconolactonase (cycloisomerase 2 family)
MHRGVRASLACVAAAVLVSACGGGGGGDPPPPAPPPPPPAPAPAAYTVGGTVSGLAGSGLVLRNNGGNDLAIAANGAFTFTAALTSGTAYSVSVQGQPAGPTQTCSVASGSGAVGSNVTNVAVTCVTNTYNVGGTISGLVGAGLVLRNNGANQTIPPGATSFTLAAQVPSGGSYAVVVQTNPAGPIQTCTASNASGSVVSSDVTSVAIQCITGKFTVGGTVSGLQGSGLVLRNNGGDSLQIAADGAFTFPTLIDDATAYDVVTFAHPLNPDQECTVTRGSGTVASAIVTNVAVNCYVMGKRLFATNSLTASLTGAAINQTTGVLTAVSGVPLASGAGANGPTVTPNGRFLYVTNRDDSTISGYSVNATTGAVASVPNSPVQAGQLPIEPPTADPTGRFLYATDQANSRLFGFGIDATTGELTPAPGSPLTTAAATISVRVDPTGRFAYVVTRTAADAIALSAYGIDSVTGEPTAVAGTPFAVGTSMPMPGAMELSADGAALFILTSPQGLIHGYTLSPTTGLPEPMSGSPFTPPSSASRLRPHPRLPVLYVGGSNFIAAYQVGATLTPLTGSPYAINGSANAMVFDPGTRFLYAAMGNSGIKIFEIDGEGVLAPLINGNFTTPFAPENLVADPGGRYLFISEFATGNIQPIAVNTGTGRLSLVQGSTFNGGTGTNKLAIAK